MLNRITAVQVCDATDDDSSNAAGKIKFQKTNSKFQDTDSRLPTNDSMPLYPNNSLTVTLSFIISLTASAIETAS